MKNLISILLLVVAYSLASKSVDDLETEIGVGLFDYLKVKDSTMSAEQLKKEINTYLKGKDVVVKDLVTKASEETFMRQNNFQNSDAMLAKEAEDVGKKAGQLEAFTKHLTNNGQNQTADTAQMILIATVKEYMKSVLPKKSQA